MRKIRVMDIFDSFNGEVTSFHQGSLTRFIRLAGCNLMCSYCDTKYAQNPCDAEVEILEEEKLLELFFKQPINNVTITGGEPFFYEYTDHILSWIINLLSAHFPSIHFTIESNGTILVPDYFYSRLDNICLVLDFKLPGSGYRLLSEEKGLLYWGNYSRLRETDFVKFVCLNEKDFYLAVNVMNRMIRIGCKAKFAFGSVDMNAVLLRTMASVLLRSNASWEKGNIVINYQLHKSIFPIEERSESYSLLK